MSAHIKLGFVPTRRSVFSAPDALKYRDLTAQRLTELGIDFVDIKDINPEGLLFADEDVAKIAAKFRKEKVDGIILAHCNFGTEYVCARLARELGLPVLLWGPLDERPLPNGRRLRDTQCGLFATGKVLRRFDVKFSYLTNCRLSDPVFERGIRDFMAVCNVVRTFKHIRILQMGPRPFDFWTTMCNEGELLEKFNIQLSPVPLPELIAEVKRIRDHGEAKEELDLLHDKTVIKISEPKVETVAALARAMKNLIDKYGCQAGAIQCWTALQGELGIMPCAANAILNDMGIPVVCETDIHGAITALLTEAAVMNRSCSFFADWTVRHPDNPNGELLQHCGPWPISIAKEKPELTCPIAFKDEGSLSAEAKHGDKLTITRFDGDHGEYSLLLGNAKSVDGPHILGTYMWIEVENIKRLEEKIVTGPYIHHCVGVYEDVVPVLYEACKYIGIKPDFYDPIEEQVKAYLRGE
ncbi:MAG TPA: L-fucose/L-arabinose isomerase family protein [Candidatus Anaerobiospirillum pullistercoris]|uniref:L-fucose/L-arabinose isomerase family protein n=1 Tax=Candidatus Anaerobiospirillum pullistercoris TaxID=2838452 RepID=A0A9D1WBR9_9GAMM|nr:L-fucose/L-arabinose isomerase family protein [Candidatus Anaerobiospirillum pullistercoris]